MSTQSKSSVEDERLTHIWVSQSPQSSATEDNVGLPLIGLYQLQTIIKLR